MSDPQTKQPEKTVQQPQTAIQVVQPNNEAVQKSQQTTPAEEKRVVISSNQINKLKKDLYLDVATNIYNGNYKNYRIDKNLELKSKGVVQSYYFMQGSLACTLTYFAGTLLMSRNKRYTKSNLDMMAIFFLTMTAGVSGYVYNSRINNIQTHFQWENGKFKNINVVEYKKDPESYVKYLLEE